jgi:DNA repair protein RecN (Recombination protein N)
MAEIDAVSPLAGEEEDLAAELTILENAEKLFASTGSIYAMIYDGDQSIRDQLVVVRNTLQDLSGIDPSFVEAAKECGSAEAIVTELAKFIQAYNARVEFNPERLELLRDRLGRLAMLKKKYGGSVESTLAHREAIGGEVLLAANFDEVISGLETEREKARNACAEKAMRLSSKRHDIGRKIDSAVVAELEKLGIRHAKFSTRMEQRELREGETGPYVAVGKRRIRLGSRGCDDVEFYLSTNLGEEAKPLVQVASGGEVSRIMLALKTILAKSDRLPVLIFDEIDVGISGRVAQAVGQSLKSLSAFHQVIAITHLPQIAGLAETHHMVSKEEREGRTSTSMRRLSLEEQVREVAKLMSGAEVTDAGLRGARELMGLGATG